MNPREMRPPLKPMTSLSQRSKKKSPLKLYGVTWTLVSNDIPKKIPRTSKSMPVSRPISPPPEPEESSNYFSNSHKQFGSEEIRILSEADRSGEGKTMPLGRSPSRLEELKDQLIGVHPYLRSGLRSNTTSDKDIQPEKKIAHCDSIISTNGDNAHSAEPQIADSTSAEQTPLAEMNENVTADELRTQVWSYCRKQVKRAPDNTVKVRQFPSTISKNGRDTTENLTPGRRKIKETSEMLSPSAKESKEKESLVPRFGADSDTYAGEQFKRYVQRRSASKYSPTF